MQGVGLLPLLLGKTTNSTTGATYCETHYPNEFGWSTLRALRTGQYKYINAPKPELYDLARDPEENQNLYQTKPAVALDLKAKLNNLLTRITPKEPLRRSAVVALGLGGPCVARLCGNLNSDRAWHTGKSAA